MVMVAPFSTQYSVLSVGFIRKNRRRVAKGTFIFSPFPLLPGVGLEVESGYREGGEHIRQSLEEQLGCRETNQPEIGDRRKACCFFFLITFFRF